MPLTVSNYRVDSLDLKWEPTHPAGRYALLRGSLDVLASERYDHVRVGGLGPEPMENIWNPSVAGGMAAATSTTP